jgi:uncharacterized protein (TIGR03437 family)
VTCTVTGVTDPTTVIDGGSSTTGVDEKAIRKTTATIVRIMKMANSQARIRSTEFRITRAPNATTILWPSIVYRQSMLSKAALPFIGAVLFPLAALATDCRFVLADQSNWDARSGFYLDLENTPAGSPGSCQMQNMIVATGVADGAQWQFIVGRPAWTLNHQYTAKAVVTPAYFELYLDGQLLGHVNSGFAGLPSQQLLANSVPSWAEGPANYLVTQTSLAAAQGDKTTVSEMFPAIARPVPLMLLAPGTLSQSAPFEYAAGDSLTLTAVFTLTAISADPKSYAPYVDTYGQSVYSTFPGKIQSDADLKAAAAEEQVKLAEWGTPTGYDAWGGVLNAGWQDTATGFFHVVQHNSVWWLISPAGNPCFYVGLDTGPLTTGNNTPSSSREWEFAALPAQSAPYNAAWGSGDWGNTGIRSVSFDTWNMIRKYGSDAWQTTATNLTVQRMHAWAFSGFGKWASKAGNLPILPVLEGYGVPLLTRHADVFDPSVQTLFRASLLQQMQPGINDPATVGWSYGNEYDEIIAPAEVTGILAMGSAVPAKRALVNQALSAVYNYDVTAMAAAWRVTAHSLADLYAASPAPPAADIETLREYYADQYYGFLYRTVKSIDPNHLYFGFWIVPGWWVNAQDWPLIAAHVDVIGYDRYALDFEDSLLRSLAKSTGKPIFLGEFSFPSSYNLLRGYEVYAAASAVEDADSGALYQSNLEAAARNPWCVGVAWFEYRDEPVSGRGFLGETDQDLVEGEDYAFGMVDVADRPKYDLVEKVRSTNLVVAQHRLAFEPPVLNAGGIVNNASFAGGAAVAPGSLVSIFGTGLAGATTLTLGGFPVPIVHTLPLQVDAQIPWELAGQTQADLTVVTDDLSGNTVVVPLAPFSPGLYRAGGSQGAILINGTGRLAAPANIGLPARRGVDFVCIFATGLGPVANQPASGAPAPSSPLAKTTAAVTVSIGGVSLVADFAGLAPGFAGLYQVNVLVPANAPVGDAVPVVIGVGGLSSNQVTMAVR